MRPISGFDRPSFQYLFAFLALVLIGVGAWGAVSVRRASREIERLHADLLNGQLEREKLEARAAREQSARESLTLQLARVTKGAASSGAASALPTLTLTPLTRRGPAPPPPTVTAPPATQVIALRLVLPRGAEPRSKAYQVLVRSWSGGQTVWSRSGVGSIDAEGRRAVEAYVAGDVFVPGAFEVLLSALSADGAQKEIASYEVTVSR